ncbi:MAG: hypothetical protein JNG86_00200 [Verrucomicrobiaceae bacterium]|nr:hypothetical protein [Verrucomicrobiaceae bacterium]
MILDGIIGLFGALIEGVAALAGALFEVVPLAVNAAAAMVECVVGIFMSGFTLGRMARKKKEPAEPKKLSTAEIRLGMLGLLVAVLVVGWTVVAPKVLNRTLTLVAEDGHSLPYAAMILHQSDGDVHKRTDNAGNIVVSRFSTQGVTIKDPRYVEQTWKGDAMTNQLVVGRTILGAGLDVLAGELLKPAGMAKR